MEIPHFAAIDIGTNAGRLLIGYVIPQDGQLSVKKVLLTRVPLRLGEDVFKSGKISKDRAKSFIHCISGFSHLMKAYNVKSFRAVATSAMREAKNGKEIGKRIHEKTGVKLEVINGEQEADLIFSTFHSQKLDHGKSYLFIDVGGGSTELTIIKDGQRIKSRSFKIGTLRMLSGKVLPSVWNDIENWLNKSARLLFKGKNEVEAICTGGNANRLIKLNGKKYLKPLTLKEIAASRNYIAQFSQKERIEQLRLKPDRADVIVPASDIYLGIMKMANIHNMYVPKMGLADGLILQLHKATLKQKK